jgi:zinc protease
MMIHASVFSQKTIDYKKLKKPTLVEEVKLKGDEIAIPYKKFLFPNGLTLIVHEDKSDPIVHVDVTYHVGSAREVVGRSGFAHFFEHMMFQGSDNVADEEHFKIVTESGGTLNGTTNTDRTNYFETLPSNQLEIALWLEADRMGFFLDAVTQEKFEVQRATVKNERGQNYDNRPYGLVYEKTLEALYPFGHPYSWSTIGYIEDLDAANLDDLKNFFLRWYGPNNAVLTVAGDVNADEVVKLVDKYFGSIPEGPAVSKMKVDPVVLDKHQYISYEDNIRFPLIMFTFPTVPHYHPDEPALDLLSEILGGGKNSIFYQNFIKTQKALNTSVSHPCSELAGTMSMMLVAYPGTNLAEMEKLMREAIAEFEKRGITDEDLQKFKVGYEARELNSLASVSGKASKLASYQTFTGNPNQIKDELDRYSKVTKEDVMRVYNKYIKDKYNVVLSAVPKGQSNLIAAPDNTSRKFPDANYKPDLSEYQGLVYKKAKDNFDRSKKPASGPNPVIKVPSIYSGKYDNGVQLVGSFYDELPIVSVRLFVKAGQIMESTDKAGISSLLAEMMEESTGKFTSEEIESEFEKLGSSISIKSDREDIVIIINTLSKNFDATMKLVEEVLFNPKFSNDDFERVKKQQLEAIANQKTQPTVVSRNVMKKLLYDSDNILSFSELGTKETVSNISLEDLKNFYTKFFAPDFSTLVVVGKIKQDDVKKATSFLTEKWKKREVKMPEQVSSKKAEKTTIYFVDKTNAPQSQIVMGFPALFYDGVGKYYRATIMNYPLGGAFNSRINLNLREDKGYTYGARSSFIGGEYTNVFTAGAGVRADATDSSVVEFIKEITEYSKNGITEEELQFTKNSIGQVEALKYETPSQKASFLKTIVDNDLDKDLVKKQQDILKNITKKEIDQLAKELLTIDKTFIVIVGDKEKYLEAVKRLGYPVVLMNEDGEVIK